MTASTYERAKRLLDVLCALLGLVLLGPFMLGLAFLLWMKAGRPILFRQTRVGLNGRDFTLLKFRTMERAPGDEAGRFDPGNTARVTRLGWCLRRWKLDELPQLWNVLRGDMSLVGPRPEIRKWVDAFPERWGHVHTVRPGITDPAAVLYCNEEALLAQAADPEAAYRNVVLPHKLDLYDRYVTNRSMASDLRVLWKTATAVILPSRRPGLPFPSPVEQGRC